MPSPSQPIAVLGGWVATDLREIETDLRVLDGSGRWAVCIGFEGTPVLARFARWERRPVAPDEVGPWHAPDRAAWRSTLDEPAYRAAVERVRAHIARGEVYQTNVCRTVRAPLDPRADLVALHGRLQVGNPAPYAGALRLPEVGVHVASASPELFLGRRDDLVWSSPIKGTAAASDGFLAKDSAENVMIVDLVRNDLGRVCAVGSVGVPSLLGVQPHPGLVHLVSTVAGDLRPEVGWPQLLDATFPPGSVTGAPKLAALQIIGSVEAGPRGPYCGAFGWVDADRHRAELAVTIRTFWREEPADGTFLAFGTGAGITWDSEPGAEWRETELKAERLLRLACDQEVP